MSSPLGKPWALRVSSEASLVDDTSHTLSQLIAGGIKHILGDFTGEDCWKLESGFFQVYLPARFPFTDLAVFPFVVINLSWEFNSIQSPGVFLVNP